MGEFEVEWPRRLGVMSLIALHSVNIILGSVAHRVAMKICTTSEVLDAEAQNIVHKSGFLDV